ncbi:MAG: energy transducer TonB [Bacteroidota bacterium]
MEMGNILSADVLDIIFDQRNKEYGAYDLRKNYQRRLTKSIVVMILVVILLLLTYMLVAAIKPKSNGIEFVKEVTLIDVTDKKKIEPPPVVIPPKQIEPPKERMIRDMVPLIVKNDVPLDQQVPEQKDVDDAKIGNANIPGKDDDGIISPPVDVSKNIVDAPKKLDDDGIYIGTVEIESQYPGGFEAWKAFLNRNLSYPQDAVDIELQGTVTIQFIVDKEGNVSDVTAISGPEQLRNAAITVIKKSGKWTAAIQNGRKVKSYKRQPVTFRLATDQ